MNRPRLVLLDEPTVAADVQTRVALLEFVRRLVDDGAAVCYSTHYLQEVETLDATVALLDRGRVIERGTVRGLLDAHADTVVELRFDGPAPAVDVDGAVVHGDVLVVTGRQPQAAVAGVLARLDHGSPGLVGVDVLRPSLDTVFLALTGRRTDTDDREPAHVA